MNMLAQIVFIGVAILVTIFYLIMFFGKHGKLTGGDKYGD